MSHKKKLYPLDYHEITDRTYVVVNMLQDYLIEHQVTKQHKKLKKKFRKAEKHLLEAYQLIANL